MKHVVFVRAKDSSNAFENITKSKREILYIMIDSPQTIIGISSTKLCTVYSFRPNYLFSYPYRFMLCCSQLALQFPLQIFIAYSQIFLKHVNVQMIMLIAVSTYYWTNQNEYRLLNMGIQLSSRSHTSNLHPSLKALAFHKQSRASSIIR